MRNNDKITNGVYKNLNKELRRLYLKYKTNEIAIETIKHEIYNVLPEKLNNLKKEIKTPYVNNTIGKMPPIKNAIVLPDKLDFKELSKPFFYLPSAKLFVLYDNRHYKIIYDSDIWQHIKKNISEKYPINKQTIKGVLELKRQVSIRKNQTTLLKYIKNKCLLTTEPHKNTIDNIIGNISPILIKSKSETIYFLTVLGDSILNKSGDTVHYIHPLSRHFFDYIKKYSTSYFKQPLKIDRKIKYLVKFDDDAISDTRIIRVKYAISKRHNWMEFIKTNFIDFIVVACFFSNHYHNADNCFARIENEHTRESMAFFNGKTGDSFVKDFVDGIKLNKCPHHTKKYKFRDIEYLWALYLDKHYIHHEIIKHNVLGNHLRNLMTITKKKEFVNINSEILTNIDVFKEFWDTTINYDYETYYDFGEIKSMFELWQTLVRKEENKSNKKTQKKGKKETKKGVKAKKAEKAPKEDNKLVEYSENKIFNILNHYYDDDILIKNSNLFHKKCKIWDKNQDIDETLIEYNKQFKNEEDEENNEDNEDFSEKGKKSTKSQKNLSAAKISEKNKISGKCSKSTKVFKNEQIHKKSKISQKSTSSTKIDDSEEFLEKGKKSTKSQKNLSAAKISEKNEISGKCSKSEKICKNDKKSQEPKISITYENCEKIYEFYRKLSSTKSFLFIIKKDYFCSYLLSKNMKYSGEIDI